MVMCFVSLCVGYTILYSTVMKGSFAEAVMLEFTAGFYLPVSNKDRDVTVTSEIGEANRQ